MPDGAGIASANRELGEGFRRRETSPQGHFPIAFAITDLSTDTPKRQRPGGPSPYYTLNRVLSCSCVAASQLHRTPPITPHAGVPHGHDTTVFVFGHGMYNVCAPLVAATRGPAQFMCIPW